KLEPPVKRERGEGAPDRRRRRRTATYADTTAIAPSTSMRRPKSRAEIPRGPCGFAPPYANGAPASPTFPARSVARRLTKCGPTEGDATVVIVAPVATTGASLS